jgi:heme exporter protein C
MSDATQETDSPGYGLMGLTAAAVLTALAAIFIYVPTEQTEGAVQRIMYFHVPSAWIAFFAFFIVFLCSILYLWKKDREWDIYAHASAEIGIIFCSLVLITGPLWAKPIWGRWWVWDPRLTLTLVLWLIYVAYLMLRAQSEPGATRAKYAAVIGIVGFLDIPLIHFSVLWWRGFHPQPKIVTPEGIGTGMDTSMLATLMISLGAFTLLYFLLMSLRVRLERMKDEIDRIKKERLYSH